jgi:lipase chaperone LimK
MKNIENLQPQETKIQGLVDCYLRTKTTGSSPIEGQHLDEDSLTAFVEGNLSERESKPIVGHLVKCSFCRHITAELVKLDLAFAGEEVQAVASQSEQQSKISEVLNGLLARIFGTNDGAVFAHQEDEKTMENAEKPEDKEDKEGKNK